MRRRHATSKANMYEIRRAIVVTSHIILHRHPFLLSFSWVPITRQFAAPLLCFRGKTLLCFKNYFT